jgi:hypothetical protein
MQTLQPYIESGLVHYHWVNKTALPVKGEPGKLPPQLAVSSVSKIFQTQPCPTQHKQRLMVAHQGECSKQAPQLGLEHPCNLSNCK